MEVCQTFMKIVILLRVSQPFLSKSEKPKPILKAYNSCILK